jgi:hypothetical protein
MVRLTASRGVFPSNINSTDGSRRRQIMSEANDLSTSELPSSFSHHTNGKTPQLEFYSPSTADRPGNESSGPDFETSLGAFRPLSPLLPVSVLSPQDRGAAQSRLMLHSTSDFQASDCPSSVLERGPSSPSRYPVEPNVRSRPVIEDDSALPWNRPPDAPPTTISGGTFISGNVTNIQQHGENGESSGIYCGTCTKCECGRSTNSSPRHSR